MPLACRRSKGNTRYIKWAYPATILAPLSDPLYNGGNFTFRSNFQCVKLQRNNEGPVIGAEVKDLMEDTTHYIQVKKYVVRWSCFDAWNALPLQFSNMPSGLGK